MAEEKLIHLAPTPEAERDKVDESITHVMLMDVTENDKAEDTIIHLAPIEGQEDDIFGVGMNCLTGEPMVHTCVTGFVMNMHPQAVDEDHIHTLVVQDSSSFASLVSTSMSASASGPSWAVSGSASSLQQDTASDTCISFVGMRVIKSKTITASMRHATIDQKALDLLDQQGVNAFIDRYGTHCVFGVCYGGTFMGRLKIETHTASAKQVVATALSASISAFGATGSVDVSMKSEIDSASAHSETSLESTATGAGAVQYGSGDLHDMMAACNGFTLQHDAARNVDGEPVSFECRTWDQFAEIADILANKNMPNAMRFSAELATMTKLSAEYSALLYVEGTCRSLLVGENCIPMYRAVLENALTRAAAARDRIRALSMVDMSKLGDDVDAYLLSARLKPIVDAIGSSDILVHATYSLNPGFLGEPEGERLVRVPPAGPNDRMPFLAFEVNEGGGAPQHSLALMVRLFWAGEDALTLQSCMRYEQMGGPEGSESYYDGTIAQLVGPGIPAGSSRVTWDNSPTDSWLTLELAGADLLMGDGPELRMETAWTGVLAI
jgi:hypothetical protein